MAKQTFTTGSVLTATQMNNLNANDYNWSVDSKSASYVLVAADAGKRIEMNAAGSTTITVNTGLFTAGDMVYISNIGAGTCTVTAGTASVNKSANASLALGQYQAGILYFISASSSIFYPYDLGSVASATSFTLLNSPSGTALTGSTSITVSSLSGYNKLLIRIEGMSTANVSSQITLKPNGSVFNTRFIRWYFTGAGTFNSDSGTNSLEFFRMDSGSAAGTADAYFFIDAANSTGFKPFQWWSRGSGTPHQTAGNGFLDGSAVISSIEINSSAGNFDAGTMWIYGAN